MGTGRFCLCDRCCLFNAPKYERSFGRQFAPALFKSGPAGAIHAFEHHDPGRNTGENDPCFTRGGQGPGHGIPVLAGQAFQLEDKALRLLRLGERYARCDPQETQRAADE
ncbi:MAG TPA: hypothetical protein PLL57_06100 [Flavobacteriales bacterium]|nr:hypothetical protein [Flavobacteriales bacterium]